MWKEMDLEKMQKDLREMLIYLYKNLKKKLDYGTNYSDNLANKMKY